MQSPRNTFVYYSRSRSQVAPTLSCNFPQPRPRGDSIHVLIKHHDQHRSISDVSTLGCRYPGVFCRSMSQSGNNRTQTDGLSPGYSSSQELIRIDPLLIRLSDILVGALKILAPFPLRLHCCLPLCLSTHDVGQDSSSSTVCSNIQTPCRGYGSSGNTGRDDILRGACCTSSAHN